MRDLTPLARLLLSPSAPPPPSPAITRTHTQLLTHTLARRLARAPPRPRAASLAAGAGAVARRVGGARPGPPRWSCRCPGKSGGGWCLGGGRCRAHAAPRTRCAARWQGREPRCLPPPTTHPASDARCTTSQAARQWWGAPCDVCVGVGWGGQGWRVESARALLALATKPQPSPPLLPPTCRAVMCSQSPSCMPVSSHDRPPTCEGTRWRRRWQQLEGGEDAARPPATSPARAHPVRSIVGIESQVVDLQRLPGGRRRRGGARAAARLLPRAHGSSRRGGRGSSSHRLDVRIHRHVVNLSLSSAGDKGGSGGGRGGGAARPSSTHAAAMQVPARQPSLPLCTPHLRRPP